MISPGSMIQVYQGEGWVLIMIYIDAPIIVRRMLSLLSKYSREKVEFENYFFRHCDIPPDPRIDRRRFGIRLISFLIHL